VYTVASTYRERLTTEFQDKHWHGFQKMGRESVEDQGSPGATHCQKTCRTSRWHGTTTERTHCEGTVSANVPVLSSLCWLPTLQRIKFKLAVLTYKVPAADQPDNLSLVIHRCNPLHSSSFKRLESQAARTKFSSRAFNHSAPKTWNSLKLVKAFPANP